jgi:alkanesulfonate monooxygenase SsuD/methylene tetrahydromethanopterin reductase-like flavin-dependent oxidoreductase (luciferase family)
MRLGFQVWGQHVSWADLMDVGGAIDAMGFEGLWSNDHLIPVVGGEGGLVEAESGPVWDAWMTLMGWAARTRNVTLGCMVSSVSYRNPGLLVRMATALDHASGGRAILGIGAGWNETEHGAFGFAFPSLKARLDRLGEASSICRQMLDGSPAHLVGRWFQVDGARNEPSPLQRRLPLLIGGSGERRTLPIVARDADIWNGEGDPETYHRKNARLDGLCREAGRDPSSIVRTVGLPPPLIRDDRSRAVAELARLLERHGLSHGHALATAESSPLVGPAGQVADHLRAYRDAGADEAVFDWPMPSDRETMERLADEVRSALSRQP